MVWPIPGVERPGGGGDRGAHLECAQATSDTGPRDPSAPRRVRSVFLGPYVAGGNQEPLVSTPANSASPPTGEPSLSRIMERRRE